MATRIQPERTPPTVTASTPADGATGVSVGDPLTATFSEAMSAGDDHELTLRSSETRRATSCRRASRTTRNPRRHAHASGRAGVRRGRTPLTVKGGAAASRSRRQRARRRRQLVVHDRGVAAADPHRELDDESVRHVSGRDPSRRGHERVHDHRRRARLAGAAVAASTSSCSARRRLTPAQVTTLSDWVNAGGNLVAMRPDKQLAGLLGLTDAGDDAGQRLPEGRHDAAPGAGIVGDTIQFHGTADRYALDGATAVATLYSSATTATANPAVTLRSVGTSGGQAAAFTYDLARSVVYTRQGNPAWAGQERDGVARHPPRRHVLRRRPATCSPTGSTRQDRDPAGRRAAAAARQPDHADGARPDAAAALLVPAARREGRRRHERRRPLADRAAPRALRPLQVAEPARLLVADWECVRATSYVYPDSALTDAQAAGYVRRLRGGAPPGVRLVPDGADRRRPSCRRLRHAAGRASRRRYTSLPRRSRAVPTASTGRTGRRRRRSSSRAESGSTPTTTTTRPAGSAPRPAS